MPAIVRFLTDSLPLLWFLSYHATTLTLITTYKCMHTCRHKNGFQQIQERCASASPTMWKLFLEVALVNLARSLWRPVCATVAPTPKRRPQSPQMAIPGSFQQPAPALLRPWGPLPNHPPALSLSPKEVQTAVAWDHPCSSSHTLELFPSHLYSDGQADLLLSTLATRLATRGRHVGRRSYFMVPELPYKDQLCEVSTFIVLFSFKVLPD